MNLLLFVQNFEVVFNGSRPQNKFLNDFNFISTRRTGPTGIKNVPADDRSSHHKNILQRCIIIPIEIIPLVPPLPFKGPR